MPRSSAKQQIPVRRLKPVASESLAVPSFKIRRLEDIAGEEGLVQDIHRHDFYFILFVREGHGDHAIDFILHEVRDRTVFLLRPGQVHQLSLLPGCFGYLLEFHPEFCQRQPAVERLRKAGKTGYCEPEEAGFLKMQFALDAVFAEAAAKEEGYIDAIRAFLDIFFIAYIRQIPGPSKEANPPTAYSQERFEEFISLLDLYITTQKQVASYARLMSLSAYQLNGMTRSAIGKTASEMINERIVLEAKRYLLATSSQVKEIADLLGYEDASYFVRFFRKHTGHSPEIFRQRFKGVLHN